MKKFSFFKKLFSVFSSANAVHKLKQADREDDRARAKRYLVETLGRSRGFSAKIAQWMTLKDENPDLQTALEDSVPALPIEQVIHELETAWQSPWKSVLRQIDPKGRPASLGQVHYGVLKDGREVAIKVQYPNISESVEAELKLLGWMPKMGPVSKWGFDLSGYQDAFHENFVHELNYDEEMRSQQRYGDCISALGKDIVVPEIVMEHCRPNILVQIREGGEPLTVAETLPRPERKGWGQILLKHYLYMIFHHGWVHADPHPGNFAFRKDAQGKPQVVIYDFGCVMRLDDSVRLAMLRIIYALDHQEALDPLVCLSAMGFDVEKLNDLRPVLPALLNVMFEPLLMDSGPFDVRKWNLSERIDAIAGEYKWWFRSSAPPHLIFLMRTLHGLATLLERLNVKLYWGSCLREFVAKDIEQSRDFKFEKVLPSGEGTSFNGLSKVMKVRVLKEGKTKVELTMPARVAQDIESVMDASVMETIREEGIDMKEIQTRVSRSGYVPQTIFEIVDLKRTLKVWLE